MLQETASAELAGLEGVAPARYVALASKLSLLVPEDSTIISMDTELLNWILKPYKWQNSS